MKLLKYLLVGLLALASPASAAGWLPLADSIATPVSNACSTSSGTSITFTAQATGTVNPNRISVVSINWDDSTNAGTASITAVSIGGISMIKAVSALSGAQNSNSEIWYVSNPSGTTANVVITAATAINGITIGVYSLIGFVTDPVANSVGTTSVSRPYNNKQLALAAGSRQINVSTSLSNMVNDFSSACGANLWGVHASQKLSGNGQTLTSAISPTSNTPLIALAVWTPGSPPVGSCTQSSNFFARAGTLDATHFTAYDNLICGLVSDGVWSKLDVLQIYATQNSTMALLSLVSSTYNGTIHGSPTFTADRGFTGVDASATDFIYSNFNPLTATSPLYVQNSAHISAWALTNVTSSSSGGSVIGANNLPPIQSNIFPKFSDGNVYFRINGSNIAGIANANAIGHYIANRSGSNALQGYKNGSSILTDSTASVAPANAQFLVLAQADVAGAIPDQGSGLQIAQMSIGSSLSATDATNFYNRLRTYLTAVGVP